MTSPQTKIFNADTIEKFLFKPGCLPARLWRRRTVFAVVFGLVLVPAVLATFLTPPIYYSSGSVIIGEQEPTSSGASAAWVQKLGDPADLESQLLIVRSRRMIRLALARENVTEAVQRDCQSRRGLRTLFSGASTCAKLLPASQELVEYADARYSARAVGRSRVIAIGFESPLPDVAAIMANALLVTYLEDQRAENARSRATVASWLLKEASRADAGADEATQRTREKFYLELHKRATDLETERRTLVSGGRLVSLAEVPSLPYFPKRTPMLAAGLTLAIVLAVLVALRRDATDGTIRRISDVTRVTKVDAVAVLPPPDSSRDDLATEDLLARLLVSGRRRFLIASALPREGKTELTLALARLAANCGYRVLVVDGNCRSPQVARRLGIQGSAGLAEVLSGKSEPADAAVSSNIPGLDAIAASSPTIGMALLLLGERLAHLVDWSQCYELVLIDGPASTAGIESALLVRSADGVVWCARWGSTSTVELAAAIGRMQADAGGDKFIGVAITSANLREQRYFDAPALETSELEGRQ